MYKRGMAWAAWAGAAAMAQRDPARQPDHDLPPEHRCKPSRVKRNQPRLPQQAKVIRRFPWAANSLGTLEYTQDLEDEAEEPVGTAVNIAQTTIADLRERDFSATPDEVRARAYVSAFRCKTHKTEEAVKGKRCLPNPFGFEGRTALSPSDSLGHCMMTAGLAPLQYFWCRHCGSHTSQRARNLTRQCSKKMRNPRAARC